MSVAPAPPQGGGGFLEDKMDYIIILTYALRIVSELAKFHLNRKGGRIDGEGWAIATAREGRRDSRSAERWVPAGIFDEIGPGSPVFII